MNIFFLGKAYINNNIPAIESAIDDITTLYQNRVIIAGSRNLLHTENYNIEYVNNKIDKILSNLDKEETIIISGMANGADKLGAQYSSSRWISLVEYPADWNRHGKSAGYKRNQGMADIATHLIVFWDMESKGTKHMIDIARNKGLKIRIIDIREQLEFQRNMLIKKAYQEGRVI